MNKKLLKIGVGVGVPIAITGLVTGLVLGLKKDEPKKVGLSRSASVKDFNDNIEPNMKNSFMYPRNGYFLNDKLILLQPDSNDKKNLVDENDKESKWSETIKFEELLTKQDIDKALQKINKDLFDFVNDSKNKSKRWGITWQSNTKHSWMILNVYHVKDEDAKDKKAIDNFIKELKNVKQKDIKNWASQQSQSSNKKTYDFVHLLRTQYMPREDEYKWHFPFSWTGESILNTKHLKTFDEKGNEVPNGDVSQDSKIPTQKANTISKSDYSSKKELNWKDNTKVKIQSKRIGWEFNTKLLENKIIPTVEPIVDFAKSSSGTTKLLLTFYFYKLDNNSIINFLENDDKVENPKNIYLRTISFDMKDIIDSLSKAKRATIIPPDETNIGKIYKTFSHDWINFIRTSPTIKAFLPMINKFIPSVGTSFKDFLDTIEFLNKLEMDKNLLISNKKPLDYIFNDKKPGKKSLSAKILEKINTSDFLMPTDAFDIWFKNFKVGELGDLDKFTSTSNFFNSKTESMSSQKLFYYLYAGSKAFEPLIRDRLNELLKDGTLKINYYDQETQNVITKFINQLKSQNILNDSFSIIDLTNKEKRNAVLVKIINAIQNNKHIVIPKEIFSLLDLNNPVSTMLASIINSDYINDLLNLVMGKDDVTTTLTDILNDPVNKLISRIMKNIDTDLGKKALENLSKKVNLKEIIKPLIPQEYMGLIDGLINGFKTRKELIDFFDKMLPEGKVKQVLIGADQEKYPEQGTLKFLYDAKDGDLVLSFATILKKDMEPLSFILKHGIKNSSKKDIGNFLDAANNIVINKLPVLFKMSAMLGISKPDIMDDISKYFKIILPTVVKQPSTKPTPEALKLANLIKALISK